MTKTALITGITGQDAFYLASLLLQKGYHVHGVRLYSATDDTQRLCSFSSHPNFTWHYGDLTDGTSIMKLVSDIQPDEIYNLAAQSHVQVSFQTPEATANINALGPLRFLEAIKTLGLTYKTRFYQASSSEMFGNMPAPQNEQTAFEPCSPYGVAKLYAYWMVKNYRDTYGLHASNGILFNHESPVRGEEFVTRKITKAVAMIDAGRLQTLMIGNLESRRDWGHAKDYVEGMWRMLQQDRGGDYVLASGQSHSVRDFVEAGFAHIGREIEWRGEGVNEVGLDSKTGRLLVKVDPQFFRPQELHSLIGDSVKAQKELGWNPRISFSELVADMVQADLDELNQIDDFNDETRFFAAE